MYNCSSLEKIVSPEFLFPNVDWYYKIDTLVTPIDTLEPIPQSFFLLLLISSLNML
jgi:hypothetical protein